MGLEDFNTSTNSGDTTQSESDTARSDLVTDPDEIDLPEYASLWISDDGLLAIVDIPYEHFKAHVSMETKDQAKEKGLVYLDRDTRSIVLTDDPREYQELLACFDIESYLQHRIAEI